MSDELLKLEDRIQDLEFRELEKKIEFLRETTPTPRRTSSCCAGDCRPCPVYQNGKQMVLSLKATARYKPEEPHHPCSPSCHSAKLLQIEKAMRVKKGLKY